MKRYSVVLPFVCAMLVAAVASAQDKGRVGLAMGAPTAVAVVWHVSEAVAIRPEISIARSASSTTVNGLTSTSTSLATSVAVSGLVYGAAHDNLRTYFSPAFTYARTSVSSTSNGVKTTSGPNPLYGVRASAGAEYALGHRFSAYGEVGINYSHLRTTIAPAVATNNAITVRSAVGAILYF